MWTGFIRPDTLKGDYMGNMSVGGQYYSGQIFSAKISAPIWHEAMTRALSGVPVQDFTAPHGFPPEPQ